MTQVSHVTFGEAVNLQLLFERFNSNVQTCLRDDAICGGEMIEYSQTASFSHQDEICFLVFCN